MAAGQTPDHWVQFLHKSLLAVVAQLGVGLVALALLPEQLGIGDSGGRATGRCETDGKEILKKGQRTIPFRATTRPLRRLFCFGMK